MAQILKGDVVAQAINKQLQDKVAELQQQGVTPVLAIVRVGEKPDDISYEKGAMKRCALVGIEVRNNILPVDVSFEDLAAQIEEINQDDSVHGCLLLRPLPDHIDDAAIRNMLDPAKDVDGITDKSLAGVFGAGEGGFPPCTAQACMEILDYYGYDLTGEKVAVIGRSLVVGKPVAMMLLARNATVTICHSRSEDLPSIVRSAKFVISAVGRANMIGSRFFVPNQVIVDVGINFDEQGKLVGDLDAELAEKIVSAFTPVPGGVGTVTTSVLVKHVVMAAEKFAAAAVK